MAGRVDRELIFGVTPGGRPDGRLVVGVSRGGGFGVLDLGPGRDRASSELQLVTTRFDGVFGVRIGAELDDAAETVALPDQVGVVVVTRPASVRRHREAGRRVLVEVTSEAEAEAAVTAGASGLVAKGAEAGGRVGEETAFVLLQRLVERIQLPIWLQGGIGLHTAAAAIAGGARGVVLDAQLALVRDSSLPDPVRAAIAAMDGSETVLVDGHRVYTRPDLPAPEQLTGRLGADDLHSQLLPVGQDAAFASVLADRYVTAGGVVQAIRHAIDEHLDLARELQPLGPGAALAASHGLRYPIAQGPMTRVSDRAGFAAAVADDGGLPFLALSLMRGDEIRALLAETRRLVRDRPWGVGILGFVPPELREEQLAVVREARPPVALIAGGRPSQAAPLEADGIRTFLHVPSPGLLDRFLKDGARRFVFEGRECGGHVGPRSSFALWELQIERLLDEPDTHLGEIEVLFAGGIHDARSAAMVAGMAAPLAERGAGVGVLMGTAYVMTAEAVAHGAITSTFQEMALGCRDTVLLETSPGHATRCVDSTYVAAFETRKAELQASGTDVRDMWSELETLNLGRLRIAAKGLARDGDALVDVDAAGQRDEGMFMIGQVAALRDEATTIASLHAAVSEGSSTRLAELTSPGRQWPQPRVQPEPLDIAVIGLAGVFPGATDVDTFWANVVAGVDAVSEVPAERWDVERYYEPDPSAAAVSGRTPSRWGGFVPAVPFDPTRYGIPPRSITSIGPDQLLSLEVAAAALADAGYATRPFDRARTAVVFGAEAGTDLASAYGFRAALPHFLGGISEPLAAKLPALTEDSFPGVLANVIAGRIANRLDLGGANYTVDAACGASMAALAAACKELTSGAADMVLCGGADLHNGIYDYLLFSAVHALSPSGRCRTFDAAADGIVLGEGIGCMVLKRRVDAERDGDRILAVIDAVAASSDGRHLGLTAPRTEGQRLALERAYDTAGVSPASVGLVEAHGTGTVVGDRTELATLTAVYTERGAEPGSCSLGSVKSQIGHTKCAAGIAGLIKAVHAVHRGVLPPTLHVDEPNSAFDPKTSPFVFNDRARPWVADTRRAAVSAFGFGGTNFHAVLSAYEDGDEPAHGLDRWPAELILLRGEDEAAARGEVDHLVGLLQANDAAGRPWRLRDLARTTAARRPRQPVRHAVVAHDLDDLAAKLAALHARGDGVSGDASQEVFTAGASADGSVAFLYPGQGSQRPHMLGDLFVAFPALRRYLELAGPDLVEQMFPPAGFGDAAQAETLTATDVAQPALGVAELALTRLLELCGVRPDATAGHSYGEIPALVAAGALDEVDVVGLSRARGVAILAAAPDDDPGAMAAVRGPADEIQAVVNGWPDLVVANDNAPDQCVISGPTPAVEAVLAQLKPRGLAARRLNVSCAFHTPRLTAASQVLRRRLAELPVDAPRRPVWSNTTAAPYPADPDAVRDQLAEQVASPVAFRPQIEAMYEAGVRTFVEVGPGRVLTQLVGKILGNRPHQAVACDDGGGGHGIHRFLLALGELAAAGVPVDPSVLFAGRDAVLVDARRVPRPAPFRLDGHLIRDRDGQLVAGSLLPATELPVAGSELAPESAALTALSGAGSPEETVTEYLRGLQTIVTAQRDVVLALLGAAPATSQPLAPAPPAPEVVAPTPPGPAEPPAELDAAALLGIVIGLVSERTGYPAEMLDPDLDLEAELSIDSIKRIEILAELAERIDLPGFGDADDLEESVIEELAMVKTLRGIVETIVDHRDDVVPSPETPARPRLSGAGTDGVERYVPRLVDLPAARPGRDLTGLAVGIVGAGSDLAARLSEQIEAAGAAASVVVPADPPPAGAALLVDLTAVDPGPAPDPSAAVVHQFQRLRAAASNGTEAIVVVTGLGGTFALPGAEVRRPQPTMGFEHVCRSAAAHGLVRTFARELPELRIRSVDVAPADDPLPLARQIVAELTCVDPPNEVGYAGGRRRSVDIVRCELDPSETEVGESRNDLRLGPHSVILVTGGARGIGARCAIGLAQRFGCTVELVGRAPLPPDADPADLAGAQDAAAVRRAIIERGEFSRPSDIEAECSRVLAAREVRQTLRELRLHAAAVDYHPVDVRDSEQLAELVQRIRHRHGRLDGVIHAAGVNEDKLIRDKTPESFARVFATKVRPVEALVDAVDYEGFVVFFGSVSGVFGNVGQVDYAAANSVLDATARSHRGGRRREHVRLLSVDWGPWAGVGMVTPELAREYGRRGIDLVDPAAGVAGLIAELCHGASDPQVILTSAGPEALDR